MEQNLAETALDRQSAALQAAARPEPFVLDALIHPGAVFAHPREVVDHPWLTDEEKRTVLLSWARDEIVAEQVAAHAAPNLRISSRIDAVAQALSRFDETAAREYRAAARAIRGRPRARMVMMSEGAMEG
jgi:hypothetical protein